MFISGYFEHFLLFVITKTVTCTDPRCCDPFKIIIIYHR